MQSIKAPDFMKHVLQGMKDHTVPDTIQVGKVSVLLIFRYFFQI